MAGIWKKVKRIVHIYVDEPGPNVQIETYNDVTYGEDRTIIDTYERYYREIIIDYNCGDEGD